MSGARRDSQCARGHCGAVFRPPLSPQSPPAGQPTNHCRSHLTNVPGSAAPLCRLTQCTAHQGTRGGNVQRTYSAVSAVLKSYDDPVSNQNGALAGCRPRHNISDSAGMLRHRCGRRGRPAVVHLPAICWPRLEPGRPPPALERSGPNGASASRSIASFQHVSSTFLFAR